MEAHKVEIKFRSLLSSGKNWKSSQLHVPTASLLDIHQKLGAHSFNAIHYIYVSGNGCLLGCYAVSVNGKTVTTHNTQ
jgi:hypothetical protein